MGKAAASQAETEQLSHNLLGQRLGRKGMATRERILSATELLLAGPRDTAISLSSVAREASLGMTTLYLYFADLTELLLAVLDPIMASAEESYVADLRTRWPDEELGAHCLKFVTGYHAFWEKHSRILHLRNNYADAGDQRMLANRISSAEPVIKLLVLQMDGDPIVRSYANAMATVLLTGVERMITLATDAIFTNLPIGDREEHLHSVLHAEARLVEMGIRDAREVGAKAGR